MQRRWRWRWRRDSGAADGRPAERVRFTPFVAMDEITGQYGLGFKVSRDPGFIYFSEDVVVTVNGLPARAADLQKGELALMRGKRRYNGYRPDSIPGAWTRSMSVTRWLDRSNRSICTAHELS
ncbi:MAG: hypothetical protein MZV70_42925 [Desulfobacterales bacterium]|nr:hypothetical protein [Desulfobacterales bacterium]